MIKFFMKRPKAEKLCKQEGGKPNGGVEEGFSLNMELEGQAPPESPVGAPINLTDDTALYYLHSMKFLYSTDIKVKRIPSVDLRHPIN